MQSLITDLQSTDSRIRNRAALELGNLGPLGVEAVPYLTVALTDSEWRVRGSAAKSLVKLDGNNVNVFVNVFRLLNDDVSSVRYEVQDILKNLTHFDLFDIIDEMEIINLLNSHLTDVKIFMLKYLNNSTLKNIHNINTFINNCILDTDHEVKLWSVHLIGKFKLVNESTVLNIVNCIKRNDIDESIKIDFLFALAKLGEAASTSATELQKFMTSNDWHMRFYSALTYSMIFRVNLPEIVITLLREAQSMGNTDEARLAQDALRFIE